MDLATWLAVALAVATAYGVDRLGARRGLDPPEFSDPVRRLASGFGLAVIFFLAVFAPAMTFGQPQEIDVESLNVVHIFFSLLLLVAWLVAWGGLGFAPVRRSDNRRTLVAWASALGLRARDIQRELMLGVGFGMVAWFGVLLGAMLLGMILMAVSGDSALQGEPAELIVWMAALPIGWRLAISLAAGVVEEIFFRGFLQPRVGIALSTVLFVAAHMGYGQPFMLFGVALLSLFYGALARWRRGVWAAMMAHFLFDAIQLLLVIPTVLRFSEIAGSDLVAAL